jgi:hypothetical protein
MYRFGVLLFAFAATEPSAAQIVLGHDAVVARRSTTGSVCPGQPERPLIWPSTHIAYVIEGAEMVRGGDGVLAVRRAFQTWQDVPSAALEFRFDGRVKDEPIGWRASGGNRNVVKWIDHGWPGPPDEPSHTLITFDCKTGLILDADILLNAQAFRFSAAGDDEKVMDVQNVVTHEVGHLIGLAHSPDEDATMFRTTVRGEKKKRDLTAEDEHFAALAYPTGADRDGSVLASARSD